MDSNDDPSMEQDPLAIPSEYSNDENALAFKPEPQQAPSEHHSANTTDAESNNSDKHSNISSADNASSSNELFSEQNLIKPELLSEQANDNQASRENHQLLQQQQQQYIQTDNNKPQTSQSYDNDNNLQQQAHEQHKAFSHSIENLSKTSDKCTPNDIKIFPNLIDAHDQFDDGYETGVGDLLSGNKYKLPSLPPPSSSPYSSMSSSSMSTISTATPTPSANLINPQQQQSPSYMSASMPPHLNQYHQSPQPQQQQMQQNQQYPMHNQQNQFNYHHLFNRMPQSVGGPKVDSMANPNDDPYRFVSDEELSNSLNSMPHSNSMQNSMHHSHHPHMASGMAPGNYSGSPSPMPPNGPSHLNHMNMSPQSGNGMNPMMQQYSEHHQMHPQHHAHHQMHPQQAPPQHHVPPQHMPNGLVGNGIAHNNIPVVMQDSPKKRGRKKKQRDENGNPVEDRPPKERKKHDRFNGMTEEEVIKRTLPDHLQHNLDIVIVGINPGLFAAYKGHHYAGPGNHFWKCLYLSGLTPQQMSAEDDYRLLQYGIGFTNMVERPTKGSADLTRKEIKEGSLLLIEKLRKFQPKIAVFNGKLIFEVFSGKKDFCFGKQPETIEGTNTYMWVMPSSSARCAQLPRAADKVPFYAALKKFRDYLNGQVPEYDESEYVFNDPKYNNISSEAELKAEAAVFGALESDPSLIDPSKKKRGRPKKIRGENGEEIITPRRPPPVNEFDDLDPSKKKRGRPKKSKENLAKNKRNSAANAAAAAAINNASNDNVPSGLPASAMNSMPAQIAQQQQPAPQIPPQHQQIQQQPPMQLNSSLINNGNGRAYLPSMNSPSQQNYGANNGVHSNNMMNHHHMNHHSQQQHLQQAPSPMNLCYSNTPNDNQQGQQPQAQTYQPSPLQSSSFSHSDLSSEISAAISSEQMVNSPVPTSPSLAQSDFEPPANMPAEDRNSVDLNRFVPQPQSTPTMDQQMVQQQQTQSTVNQSHHSPLSAAQSPVSGYSQLPHMSNNSNYNSYQQQRQTPNLQQQQNYAIHQQQQQSGHPGHPHQVPNNVNKNLMQLNSNTGNDLYKDVATKSLSGLESLVDQIPSLNDQDAMMSNNSNSSNGSNGNNPNMLATTQSASSISANDNASSLGIGGPASITSASNDDPYNNCIFSGFPSSASSGAPQPPSASTQSLVAPPMPASHHPSHYPYHTSNHPFSVNSLTSSNYSAAAAMNSYHQNLMNASHLPTSFMEPPHMPVPVTPALYHSYQQHQAAGYAGYHPAPGPPHTLHMPSPNYPQHYYSQSPPGYHSMFGGF